MGIYKGIKQIEKLNYSHIFFSIYQRIINKTFLEEVKLIKVTENKSSLSK